MVQPLALLFKFLSLLTAETYFIFRADSLLISYCLKITCYSLNQSPSQLLLFDVASYKVSHYTSSDNKSLASMIQSTPLIHYNL